MNPKTEESEYIITPNILTWLWKWLKSILCFRNRKNSRVFLSKSNQSHTEANSSIRIYKILYQKSTKNEKTPTEWKKILTNDMTTKGLISKIYKHFIHFINISIAKKVQFKKWAEELYRHFSKENVQMASQAHEDTWHC